MLVLWARPLSRSANRAEAARSTPAPVSPGRSVSAIPSSWRIRPSPSTAPAASSASWASAIERFGFQHQPVERGLPRGVSAKAEKSCGESGAAVVGGRSSTWSTPAARSVSANRLSARTAFRSARPQPDQSGWAPAPFRGHRQSIGSSRTTRLPPAAVRPPNRPRGHAFRRGRRQIAPSASVGEGGESTRQLQTRRQDHGPVTRTCRKRSESGGVSGSGPVRPPPRVHRCRDRAGRLPRGQAAP